MSTPDFAVEPSYRENEGEPEVAKTPKDAASKSFRPFSLPMLKSFGRAQAPLIDVRSEAASIWLRYERFAPRRRDQDQLRNPG